MSYTNNSDLELLAYYVQGDQQAFAALVERYQTPLFHYLYRLLAHYSLTEDVVQETFVRVVNNLWRFNPDKSFRTWLYTIATNLARNELRKNKRLVKEMTVKDYPVSTADTPDPLEQLIVLETIETLRASLAILTNQQKEILILRLQQQLCYEEIAQIVGCKPATARSRMFYALEKIRNYFEQNQENHR